ncbi:SDR family NAD(P)-dependent oxidoreductase [Actinoplanes couchii]|uniref:Oxidoreductase n=1 Tax=Actinoplanes couchii TaxID=403638 RepID=A0ABQ3X829_9ACTN|nr:SDR family oxidoreductase [Actinoplanes couchii]MDR6320321.1 3-oxoacyl-[acyl-carrier protein] reductase [Actinoplanes couchii]GID54665.1 oxidoreductase [Actinoplanes couchii]
MGEKTLAGKVALVTGGSRGIGAAVARRLAGLGADVVITYVAPAEKAKTVVEELRSMGVRAEGFQADQADRGRVTAMVDAVAEQFGRIDILVNSAAVFRAGELSDDERDGQWAINVTGVADTTYRAVKYMGSGGRVVNLSSGLATKTFAPGMSDYAASKAAISAYTRGWAQDFVARGITVNAIELGVVDTDMAVPADSDAGRFMLGVVIPMHRFGSADEAAGAVAFLVGPDASYITGTTLRVDGGALA